MTKLNSLSNGESAMVESDLEVMEQSIAGKALLGDEHRKIAAAIHDTVTFLMFYLGPFFAASVSQFEHSSLDKVPSDCQWCLLLAAGIKLKIPHNILRTARYGPALHSSVQLAGVAGRKPVIPYFASAPRQPL